MSTPQSILRGVLPLLLACLLGCKKELAEEQAPLSIIPVPREAELGGSRLLGEALIIVPRNPSELAGAAAEEINLRLRELGASFLRVAEAGSSHDNAWRGHRIELSVAPAEGVPRAPQGYMIDALDAARTRLVGRDEQGLFWAAVTFRRLLHADADGRIQLASARIRDWPDFPLRGVNRLASYYRERSERGLLAALKRSRDEPGRYADAYAYETKRAIDFLARLKLNLVWLPLGGIAEGLGDLAREAGGAGRADHFLATLRRATNHARARGIAVCDIVHCDVGTSPADDRDPALARCVLNRSQGRYHCWSLDAVIRRRAEDAARLYAGAGYGMIILQLPEGGGYTNPGYWRLRCKDCRARWGDGDRAAADAHLAAIWHRAFAEAAPGVALAVIQHPSDPAILLDPDSASYEPVRSYLAALHERLPNEPPVAVCVRESAPQAIAAFRQLFEGRPILAHWLIEGTGGESQWCPLFSSRARFAQTFSRMRDEDEGRGRAEKATANHANPRESEPGTRNPRPQARPPHPLGVLATSSSFAPVAAAAAAQYLWNADSPGAGPWPGEVDPGRDGAEGSEAFLALVPAFAAEAFGAKAGPPLAEAFRGCISPSYCLMPAEIARLAMQDNRAELMQEHYDALVRASGAIERVWQRFEAGERRLIFAETAPYFYGLSEQAARSRAWASHHLARLRALEALRRGEPRAAIAAELRDAILRVETDAALAERMDARLGKKPKAGKAEHNRWLAGSLRTRYEDTSRESLREPLQRLLDVLEGTRIEERDAPDATLPPLYLLPDDDREVALRSKGATAVSFVTYPTTGRRKTALQAEGLSVPWHDGFSVGFPAVDVADYVKAGGVLRFYANGGGTGHQQLLLRLYARDAAGATPADERPWPSVPLAEYLAIDDLEATWQLVTIPLARLLPPSYSKIAGFGITNVVSNEVCGPLWLDGLRVAAAGETIRVAVPVQEPPPQPPATEARVLACGVQASTYLTAEGLASRLMLGLKVVGNGSLSNLRIELRLLTPEGQLISAHQAVAAERIRTPWWSPTLRYSIDNLIPSAQLEMILSSDEVKATGSIIVRW